MKVGVLHLNTHPSFSVCNDMWVYVCVCVCVCADEDVIGEKTMLTGSTAMKPIKESAKEGMDMDDEAEEGEDGNWEDADDGGTLLVSLCVCAMYSDIMCIMCVIVCACVQLRVMEWSVWASVLPSIAGLRPEAWTRLSRYGILPTATVEVFAGEQHEKK
jgi:hypothetical protein